MAQPGNKVTQDDRVRTRTISTIIYPAEFLLHCVKEVLDIVFLKDIGWFDQDFDFTCPRDLGFDKLLCFSETGFISIGDGDFLAAFSGEGKSCCLTDAL